MCGVGSARRLGHVLCAAYLNRCASRDLSSLSCISRSIIPIVHLEIEMLLVNHCASRDLSSLSARLCLRRAPLVPWCCRWCLSTRESKIKSWRMSDKGTTRTRTLAFTSTLTFTLAFTCTRTLPLALAPTPTPTRALWSYLARTCARTLPLTPGASLCGVLASLRSCL